MNRFFNIILKVAAAVLAMVLATSCIFEKEEIAGKKRDVMVLLDINTADMVATKATEDPTAAEALLNTVRVYAYDSNGIMIGYADNTTATNGRFHMVLSVPEGLETIVADFYVVANEASMQNGENAIALHRNNSKQSLMELTFNALAGTALPMYGIVENVTLNLNAGQQHLDSKGGHQPGFILNQAIKVSLTRSLAKIAVYAAEKGNSTKNNVKINSVKLVDVLNSSYLFTNANYPTATPQEVVLSNTQVTVDKKLNSTAATDRQNTENYTSITSAPHYIHENPAGKKLVINYTTGSGAAKNAEITMPAIVRNTFYKVLCLVKADGEMSLELVVADWEEGTGKSVDFKDLPEYKKDFKWNNVIGNTYQFGVSANEEVKCTFEITSPVDGMWYATLTDGDVQNYAFKENGLTTICGEISDNKHSFTLMTLNNNYNSGSSRRVKLVITVVNSKGRSMVLRFNDNEGFFIVEQANM
jgi:hypothetical protein